MVRPCAVFGRPVMTSRNDTRTTRLRQRMIDQMRMAGLAGTRRPAMCARSSAWRRPSTCRRTGSNRNRFVPGIWQGSIGPFREHYQRRPRRAQVLLQGHAAPTPDDRRVAHAQGTQRLAQGDVRRGDRAPADGNARSPISNLDDADLCMRSAHLGDRRHHHRRCQVEGRPAAHPLGQGRHRTHGAAARWHGGPPEGLLEEDLAQTGLVVVLWQVPRTRHQAGHPEAAFNRARDLAGIASHHTFHGLRHSAATHMFEAGGSIDVIQDALGHRSADTTRNYARATSAMFKDLSHPISKSSLLSR